ncbi:hypothetical protein [Lentzea sp. CA-135723]
MVSLAASRVSWSPDARLATAHRPSSPRAVWIVTVLPSLDEAGTAR